MKRSLLILPLLIALNLQAEEVPRWRLALPGYTYAFPRDHHSHPGFKTEWWYATGNLQSESGQNYGYQFTIFRQGIRPPNSDPKPTSRFVRDHFYFAHIAISDISGKKFYFDQITSRGAFDDAGTGEPADSESTLAFLPGNTQIRLGADHSFHITSDTESADGTPFALDLHLTPAAPEPIIQGKEGVSQKSAGEGHASHYYSYPNLSTKGTLTLGKETPPVAVTGKSWLDREWSTSMLAKNQVGWDWFALRLEDGRHLMLYQLRQKDGKPDPASSGTVIAKDRTTRHLESKEFTLTPAKFWKSPHTGAEYPTEWRIEIPSEKIEITATAAQNDQELALPIVRSYEGAIEISGTHRGQGYMELTGYAGPLTALTP